MFTAILVSVAVVFVAELGDKSQLITMTYALRHRWWVVLSGVGIAALLVHGLSVTIGHFLGVTLPQRPIAFAASFAFLLFAAWTWRTRTEDGADQEGAARVAEPRLVIFAIVSSFVLAELGDKTMLATVALASDQSWAGVWIGATIGMVLADGVAIAVGSVMHRRLPTRFLHTAASLLFLLFGLFLFFDGGLGLPWVAVTVTGTVSALAVLVGAAVWTRGRASAPRPSTPPAPEPSPGADRQIAATEA